MTKVQKIDHKRQSGLIGARQAAWQHHSLARKMRGYSRDSFHRFKEPYDKGGELAPQEISRKNRSAPEIEAQIDALSLEQMRKLDYSISPSGCAASGRVMISRR